MLGVKGDHRFGSWGDKPVVAGTATQIADDLDPGAWQRLSAGQGTKGERVHDWAYFELADLEADEYVDGAGGTWTRGLLICRHVAGDDLAFFTTWVARPARPSNPGRGGRASLGHLGQLRDRQE